LKAEDAFFAAGAAASRRNYRAVKVCQSTVFAGEQRCAFRPEIKSGFGT